LRSARKCLGLNTLRWRRADKYWPMFSAGWIENSRRIEAYHEMSHELRK
jgi:hypothetical protein